MVFLHFDTDLQMHQLPQTSLWLEVRSQLPVGYLLPLCFKTLLQHFCFPKLLELLWSSQIYYNRQPGLRKLLCRFVLNRQVPISLRFQ